MVKTRCMVKIRELLTTIMLAFNPAKYDVLAGQSKRKAMWYFCCMVFLVFIITSVLMVPNLLKLPQYLQEEISKFDQLKLNVEYQQKEPMVITTNMPILTVDTINEHADIDEGTVLITKNAIFYRFLPFGPGTKIVTGEENSLQGVNVILMILFVAALPVLLIGVFLYGLIKYLLVIILAACIGLVVARCVHYGLTFREVFNISMFAGTPLVVLGLLTKPFIPSLGYLEYVIFLAYFFLGCIKVGDFEEVKRRSQHSGKDHEFQEYK